jgi:hypothetical protein
MKQTAVEWIIEEINQQQKSYIDLAKKDKSLKKGVDAILTATTLLKMKCEQAKEIEKQQINKCSHPLPYRFAKSDVNFECTLCGKFI